ncbi:uncharacterized protein LOC143148721 isoform X1 [Ptiloglossa arizonensis]|uniref:uncharacterized protein LOC143148721 isoform X1 n=1 Tax=Ptiloglossa arizonensis TaxID=3350558 RepID=UPI003F9F85D9
MPSLKCACSILSSRKCRRFSTEVRQLVILRARRRSFGQDDSRHAVYRGSYKRTEIQANEVPLDEKDGRYIRVILTIFPTRILLGKNSAINPKDTEIKHFLHDDQRCGSFQCDA